MTSRTVYPVLLAGGSGTRLWPTSRKSYPKQFSDLLGKTSLFQSSARRVSGPGFAPPVVVTAEPFRFIVTEQLAALEIAAETILIEPTGKNTAPAALAAVLSIARKDPDALILVTPSDHAIPDAACFLAAVEAASEAALAGELVTFGVPPDRPEPGYGYLALADDADPAADGPQRLKGFVEKPAPEMAETLLNGGRHLWNAGIFLFTAKAILEAFRVHAPDLVPPVEAAVSQAKADLGFVRLAAEPWSQVKDISIDYAIMEKVPNLSVMPFRGRWSDLGSWDSVWQETGPDADGNALSDGSTAIDCRNTLLRSESDRLRIVGIGLDDIVAVAMPDAVLVARKGDSQRVREAVEALSKQGARQAHEFPRDHRPWGWFESLVIGNRFQVKRIVVHPGAALSLQSHMHRAEHWIVVQGTAKVTIDDKVSLVPENQSVFIPLGARHRMENPGKVPMVLIEVQTGSYLGEDDIIRYEDIYARS